MAKKHVWRVKKQFFHQLENGEKSLEVRVGYTQIKKVAEGDVISFENYGPNEFDVVRIATYDCFERLLEMEGVENVLPGMTFGGAVESLREIYPEDRERLGVYAFELRYRGQDRRSQREFVAASALLRNGKNKKFAKLVAESYMLTDWISEDYPDHVDHFYSEAIDYDCRL